MEYLFIYKIIGLLCLILAVASTVIVFLEICSKDREIIYIISFFIFFVVFITCMVKIQNTITSNLEELGCTYIGSGKKGPPHIPPKKYYRCPDGAIRS